MSFWNAEMMEAMRRWQPDDDEGDDRQYAARADNCDVAERPE
jgi:hypothetical protein